MQQPKILVAIRKRPLSKKQLSKGEQDIVTVKSSDTVIVSEYKQKVDLTKFLEETIFNFDYAFHEEVNNEEIYERAVKPLVESAFEGAKVTCFAYGQTGSGKTYTMNGSIAQGVQGLYSLGAQDIFNSLSSHRFSHLQAKLSFFQIYCGKLFDLLNKRQQLKLRQDNKNNINIIGMVEANVHTTEEFTELLNAGSAQRITSQNSANADSSRSHAILQISLKDGKKLFGKISFIDLAGNQRGADHMDMDKQTRIDGAEINKSLLSLKQCIRALDQGKGHTPFRGSKLTMVLKDSFVGFCRTVMIGNVSPSSASSENTLNTLRYADRVKQLRKPQQNFSREQIKAKQMMLPRQNKNAIRIMIDNDDDADDIAKKREFAQKEYGIVDDYSRKLNGARADRVADNMNNSKHEEESQRPRKNSFHGRSCEIIIDQEQKSTSLAKLPPNVGRTIPITNNLTQMPINAKTLTKNMNPIPNNHLGNTKDIRQGDNRGDINRGDINRGDNNRGDNNRGDNRQGDSRGDIRDNLRQVDGRGDMRQGDNRGDRNDLRQGDGRSDIRQGDGRGDGRGESTPQRLQNQSRGNQSFNNPQRRQQPMDVQPTMQPYAYGGKERQRLQFQQGTNLGGGQYSNRGNYTQTGQNQNYQQNSVQQGGNGGYQQNGYNQFNGQQQNYQQLLPPQQSQLTFSQTLRNGQMAASTNFNTVNPNYNYNNGGYNYGTSEQPQTQAPRYLNQFQANYSSYTPPPPNFQLPLQSRQNIRTPPQISARNPPVPQTWQEMVAALSTSTDQQYNERITTQMDKHLLKEQSALVNMHNQTLKKQIETIKGEMSVLAEIDNDKGKYGSRDYVKFMQEMIQEKISSLQLLRQSLVEFMYKLDDKEQIESNINFKDGAVLDDEQLLDDIN